MRKLYRKSTVHPTLTSSSSISDSDRHLACFLPAAILTLAAALSPEDKEVLAYLLSSSCSTCNSKDSNLPSSCNCYCNCKYRREKQQQHKEKEHCALFSCSCFRCYMSYWIRWDSSPNRQLIHEIIDAFEDNLVNKKSTSGSKKNRRSKKAALKNLCVSELTRTEFDSVKDVQTGVGVGVVDGVEDGVFSDGDDDEGGMEEFDNDDKGGSMRKFASFIGDRIWGVFRGKEN